MVVLGDVLVSTFFFVLLCLYRCCTITAVALSFFFFFCNGDSPYSARVHFFFFDFCSLLGNTFFFFPITFQN